MSEDGVALQRLLDGKVALVTGGASGIGRASALAFARAGARVAVADVQDEGGEATIRLIQGAGGEAIYLRCDVSRASDVRALVDETIETFGRIDCAFNNAGIEGVQALTADYPEDAWDRVMGINLRGLWLCMKHEIPGMLAQRSGAIVNNASILGMVAFAKAAAYVAAKHAVLGLTRTAALEYSASGVRINAVCPGFIETPMLQRAGITADPGVREMIAGLHPMKRLGRPEEVADAVVWLCSEGATFVTGHALLVDGGYVVQ
jgi:NAD(P)-dependent dehydrogenase (short-subunit alcohol dehydrogenase family)